MKARPTGIARYIEHIVPAMLTQSQARDDEWAFVLGVRPHRFGQLGHSPLARRELRRLRPLVRPYRALLGRVDVMHSLGAWQPRDAMAFKSIVTIHDVHTIDAPQLVSASRASRRARKLRHAAGIADAIITPSEFTRERVITTLGVAADRVFAIPHGITTHSQQLDAEHAAREFDRLDMRRPFVLGTGDSPRRKRGDLLINAWDRSAAREDFDLVLFGGDADDTALQAARTGSTQPSRVHLLGRVSDSLLFSLYHHARALIVPSAYEGFGIPLIEAMAAGCPVAASDLAVFVEVASGTSPIDRNPAAAHFFAALSIEDCAAAIDTLCADDALCERLIATGRQRAARYTWPTAARATLAVYQSVLRR